MQDLFDATENEAMLARIAALRPDSAPQWGKMDVAQMLSHCQVALDVALARKKLKRGLIGVLFGGFAKRGLLSEKPFGKNMPTAPEFKVSRSCRFDLERDKLEELVRTFAELGPAGLSKEPHPFFGPLTSEEWSKLQWKHLDHHLRQFAC